jgi:hypothetical protein
MFFLGTFKLLSYVIVSLKKKLTVFLQVASFLDSVADQLWRSIPARKLTSLHLTACSSSSYSLSKKLQYETWHDMNTAYVCPGNMAFPTCLQQVAGLRAVAKSALTSQISSSFFPEHGLPSIMAFY